MAMSARTPLEAMLEHDRAVVLTGLLTLATLAWIWLGRDAVQCACAMGTPTVLALFAMWAVMMVAMMVPSVAPTVLLFAGVNRRRRETGRPFVPTAVFVGGYLAAWTAFSAGASAIQALLQRTPFFSPRMAFTHALLGAGVLIVAGLFQLTPLKRACLVHCRNPLSFLMTEWREGVRGALVMGWRHGAYCVGCCWLLMALLFVAGVMDLRWVAALSAFVLAEKLVPARVGMSRLAGVALVVAGAWTALASTR